MDNWMEGELKGLLQINLLEIFRGGLSYQFWLWVTKLGAVTSFSSTIFSHSLELESNTPTSRLKRGPDNFSSYGSN